MNGIERKITKVRIRKIDKKYWSSQFIKDKVEWITNELKAKDLIFGRYGAEITLSCFNDYEYILIDQAIGKRIVKQLQKEGFKAKLHEYGMSQFGTYKIVIVIDGEKNNSYFTDAVANPWLDK